MFSTSTTSTTMAKILDNVQFGPKNKSLATQHLEYIAYKLLQKSSKVHFRVKAHTWLAKIDGYEFNLTQIIRAADFDNLEFSDIQFYLYNHNQLATMTHNDGLELNNIELNAIITWTNNEAYVQMNKLLRNPTKAYSKSLLLTICFAAHGLKKPLEHTANDYVTVRNETYHTFMLQRDAQIHAERPVINQGFTASSIGRRVLNDYCTEINVPGGLNPMGKYIASISKYGGEGEVLFPPNTEFVYVKTSNHYKAVPIRSAKAAHEDLYQPNFTEAEQQAIAVDFLKTKLDHLHHYLRREIKKIEGGFSFMRLFSKQEALLGPLRAGLASLTHPTLAAIQGIIDTCLNEIVANNANPQSRHHRTLDALLTRSLQTLEDIRDDFTMLEEKLNNTITSSAP